MTNLNCLRRVVLAGDGVRTAVHPYSRLRNILKAEDAVIRFRFFASLDGFLLQVA